MRTNRYNSSFYLEVNTMKSIYKTYDTQPWAKFVAKDSNGNWNQFSYQPVFIEGEWVINPKDIKGKTVDTSKFKSTRYLDIKSKHKNIEPENSLMSFKEEYRIKTIYIKDAPYWAKYIAQDSDGVLHFFEEQPMACNWKWKGTGREEEVKILDFKPKKNWKKTLLKVETNENQSKFFKFEKMKRFCHSCCGLGYNEYADGHGCWGETIYSREDCSCCNAKGYKLY